MVHKIGESKGQAINLVPLKLIYDLAKWPRIKAQ